MIVVDSAAVIDALTAVPGTGELRAYLREEELHAPALLDFEVVSVLRHNVFAYDAAYVVLAESLECPLLTRDTRLARSSGHEARIEVR